MRTAFSFAAVACLALAIAGCAKKPPIIGPEPRVEKDYEAPLPPGQLALRKITDPQQVPDFTPACSNTIGLREAVQNSLDYLAKPSSRGRFPYGQITRDQAIASLQAFLALLNSKLPPSQLNEAVRRKFDVYVSVGCDERGTVLFTGYYTPIF